MRLRIPLGFLGRKAGLLRKFWQERSDEAIWRGNSEVWPSQNPKRSLAGLSKAHRRWYIPLAPRGLGPGCLLRKPPDGIGASGVGQIRFGFSEKARNGLSRGGAAR